MVTHPNFLIVGAAKAGTTSMHNYLSQHPDIFMSPVKEPKFLAIADLDKKSKEKYKEKKIPFTITSKEEYLALFKGKENFKIKGESTTIYLYYYESTISNIKRIIPQWKDIKILIILRNPTERMVSHYYLIKRKELEGKITIDPRGLFEVLSQCEKMDKEIMRRKEIYVYDYYGMSLYADAVKSYMKNFKTKVVLYDDLKKDPLKVVQDVFEFLEVKKDFVPPNINIHYNKGYTTVINKTIADLYLRVIRSKAWQVFRDKLINANIYYNNAFYSLKERIKQKIFPKKIPLTEQDILRINQECFKEDIEKLQKIINRDLSHWLYGDGDKS